MTHEHPSQTTAFIVVFFALLLLTALTLGVAYVDLQGANVAIALAIATVKAGLIVYIVMHARHSGALVWATIITGCVWVAILIGMTLTDYVTRPWLPS